MSVEIAGNIDCAKLLEIKALAEQMWPDGVLAAEYIPEIESVKAIVEGQTFAQPVLTDPQKENTVKGYWVDDCDTTAPGTDCTKDSQCEVDGEEIGTQCEDYVLDECVGAKSFSVTEEKLRTSHLSMEMLIAKALNKKLVLMDNAMNTKVLAALDLHSGVNKFDVPAGGQYAVSPTFTSVPGAAWNPDLFMYFITAMKRNKLTNGKLLSGVNLYQYFLKVQNELNMPEGAAASKKFGAFGTPVFDIFQLDEVIGAKATFLYNPNSIALLTKSRYKQYAVPRQLVAAGHETMWYSMPSPNLKNVDYDVVYQKQCVGNDVKHVWSLSTMAKVFVNPKGCDTDRTGILQFRCV